MLNENMEIYSQMPIEGDMLSQLIIDAQDFIYGQGAVFRTQTNPSSAESVTLAPVTLFPSPVSRSCFEQARLIQTDLNLLMYRVACDHKFLHNSLKSVIAVDSFTKQLWDICETVQQDGGRIQPVVLALNRSDYMIGEQQDACNTDDTDPAKQNGGDVEPVARGIVLQQVEFNTISAASAGMSPKITAYHRFSQSKRSRSAAHNVPDNNATVGFAESLVLAHQLYGNPSAVIVFLVYGNEDNVYDQRNVEYAIYGIDVTIKVVRRTLKDLLSQARLTDDKRLIVDNMEVSIVYMRCGYKPSDYDSEDVWNCRLMMERSKAVVCPTVAYQLAGTKKIQQVLAAPGMVERFIDDVDTAKRIRAVFADQYSLDLDKEGDQNAEMAIANPTRFVLKPQREGGGNNTFGEDIRTQLLELNNNADRCSYVLMRRIHPVVVKNYPVSLGKSVVMKEVVSELGIYGSLVANGTEVVHNKQNGYLMRTKPRGTDEGGIALGCSVYDSPYLVTNWPPEIKSDANK